MIQALMIEDRVVRKFIALDCILLGAKILVELHVVRFLEICLLHRESWELCFAVIKNRVLRCRWLSGRKLDSFQVVFESLHLYECLAWCWWGRMWGLPVIYCLLHLPKTESFEMWSLDAVRSRMYEFVFRFKDFVLFVLKIVNCVFHCRGCEAFCVCDVENGLFCSLKEFVHVVSMI